MNGTERTLNAITGHGRHRRRLSMSAVASAAAILLLAQPAMACTGTEAEPAASTISEARSALLCLVNQDRRNHGRGALRSNGLLQRAAQSHASNMDARNFYSHRSPSGSTPKSRLRPYLRGFPSFSFGENLGWGNGRYGTPRGIYEFWRGSRIHRFYMRNSRFHDIGIGIALGAPFAGKSGFTYTADFGYRRR